MTQNEQQDDKQIIESQQKIIESHRTSSLGFTTRKRRAVKQNGDFRQQITYLTGVQAEYQKLKAALDQSSNSGSGSHSSMVDKGCNLINKHPGAATLLGHALGLGPLGTLAQGYCGLR